MATIDFNKEISLGRGGGNKISAANRPTKTSINLVPKKESIMSTRRGRSYVILGSILALLLVVALVVMPFIRLQSANARVASLQKQLEEANAAIKEMGGIEEEYAHYTTEGMTEEELTRVNRAKVMKLVEDAVVNSGVVDRWSISGNTMTLQVSGASLAELNQVAAALEDKDMVERCVINTADRGSRADTGNVEATFVVYLNAADGSAAGLKGKEVKAQDEKKVQEAREAAEARGNAAYDAAEAASGGQ